MNSSNGVLGYRDGYALGMQMLNELSKPNSGEHLPTSVDPDERASHSPQDNVVMRYLIEARGRGPEVERGLAAVLTDYLAGCCHGFPRDPESYEQWLELEPG